MARNIPFLLEMGDGKKVRTIEELREHFDLETVRSYYADGRLIRWLKSRDYEEEAEKIEDLDPHLDSFEEGLCEVLGVRYEPFLDYSIESYSAVEVKNGRREVLRQFTADDKIFASVDNVAFTQEELRNLLEKGRKVIYLCGEQFVISGDVEDISYIGINTPTIILDNGKVKKGIDISGVEFDLCNYMEAAISNIYVTIRNDLINGDHIYSFTEDELREMINAMDNTDKFRYYFVDNPQLCVKLLNMVTKKESAVAQAQFFLGRCYIEGFGTEKNINESIKCLRCAAGLGLAEAQESLGDRYLYGEDVKKNAEEAIKWFCKAAEQGNVDAQRKLGDCYFQGEYIEKNIEEAIKWFQKAAEQGNGFAQYELGYIYMRGDGVDINLAESIKWFRKADEQDIHGAMAGMLGCYGRYIQVDVENAIKWIQECAKQRDAYAQLALGICYANGKGVEKNAEEAARWYQEAAEQGLVLAMLLLRDCYQKGKGVEQNFTEAKRWSREIGRRGLDKYFAESELVLVDKIERWLTEAADKE